MSSVSSSSPVSPSHTDVTGVLVEAWRIVRRERPLWWIGAISALQTLVYSAVVMLMVLPGVALPQIIAPLEQASASTSPDVAPLSALSSTTLAGAEAVVRYLPQVITGIVVLMICWVASGVFDVAAQAGSISQVDHVAEGGRASVRGGLRDGFAVWWQVVGLLAVAAMPALVLMLALAISTLVTYTLPLMQGRLPSPAVAVTGQVVLVPLQLVVSFASVLVGVVVQMSMRSVVIEGHKWRTALREGWGLARSHLGDVALVYLLTAIAALPVALVSTAIYGVIALVVGGLAAAVAVLAGGSVGAGVVWGIVIGSLAVTPVWFGIQAGFLAWTSAAWTVLWRRIRAVPFIDHGVGVAFDAGTLNHGTAPV